MVRNLTEGKPGKVLRQYALPMFISVIFQQMYNLADSIIVGNFAANGEDALAAVGASYPITMIFLAVAAGYNVGCNVVISQLFGGRRFREMKTAVSTALLTALVLSLTLTALGLVFCDAMLHLISTPANIFADAALYLNIYICSFLFWTFYNAITGIFTALGDSGTSLYFLIGSSLGNILLDWLFVAKLNWGVAGVAWATFICLGVACILAGLTLKKRLKGVITSERVPLFSPAMFKRIALYAIPSILQQSFVSVGNLFIQSLINSFGSSVIAGYSSAIKINTFAATCMSTLGGSLSGYTAQNVGAGKIQRVREGWNATARMALALAAVLFGICFFQSNRMIGLFMDEDSATALATGAEFLKIVSPFYFVIAIKFSTDGLLRGAGAMRYFMISTFGDLILRVGLAFGLAHFLDSTGIWLSWPIGWTLGTAMSCYFYRKGVWNKSID